MLGRHLLGDAGGLLVDLVGLVTQPVLVEHEAERAEGGGLDRVDADLEEAGVEVADDIRAGEHQVFVAALVLLAPEVVGAEVAVLDPGAEGTVEHQHALAQRVEEGLSGVTHSARQGRRQPAGVPQRFPTEGCVSK